MREVILPFWVNASYEEIQKIDLNFYESELSADLISKGIFLQGPFIVFFSNSKVNIGIKNLVAPKKIKSFSTVTQKSERNIITIQIKRRRTRS